MNCFNVKILVLVFLFLVFWTGLPYSASCEEEKLESDEIWLIQDLVSLEELDSWTKNEDLPYSFSELFQRFYKGDFSFDEEKLKDAVYQFFLSEIINQKKIVVQIFLLALVSAIMGNGVRCLENRQVTDISRYLSFLMVSVLFLYSFRSLYRVSENACGKYYSFMKVLLPVYLTVVAVSGGAVSAFGFYQLTILIMTFFQRLIIRFLLPLTQYYLVFVLMNELSQEDYFSKFADLLKKWIRGIVKVLFGFVIGIQSVQVLISPAIDRLKNGSLQKMIKWIPGIGNVIDSATETVAGAALVIKNSVGVSGMLVIVFLCLVPAVKLGISVLMYRCICAFLQPFAGKNLINSLSGLSEANELLLLILISGAGMFFLSLAMMTAAIH